jgi:putative DNA-invertase from lambdoid prophage Rac
MAIYGYVRCSLLKREKPPEAQIAEFSRKAEELGGNLARVFVDPVCTAEKPAILSGPVGKEMLETLHAGDTLIVDRLDRLGYSMRDIRKTVGVLCERGVRIYALHALDGEMDLAPATGKIILQLFALLAKTEKTLRSERLTQSAQWRKAHGLAYGAVPRGRMVVVRNGVKFLEWDEQQLRYIAEIAQRLPKEGAAAVAKDFWKRGIRDRRGKLWGKPQSNPHTRYRTPYGTFCRAARWFHRMKRKGLLPAPYDTLATLMQEPKGFREEPKPKKWIPGGTARRDAERARLKDQHHADRLARWEKEKAARIERRVHKPAGLITN